jgi:hypothetical protein
MFRTKCSPYHIVHNTFDYDMNIDIHKQKTAGKKVDIQPF